LTAGHSLTVYKDPETGDLRGFKYDLDDHTSVLQQGYANGVILVAERPIQYLIRPVSLSFAIRDSFAREMARQNVPKPIVDSLETAFEDRRSLRELPPGAALKLIYSEEISRDGVHRVPRELEAAQVRVGGRVLDAFAFRDEHGRPHLYDDHGKPLGPQTLRFPLPFEYISSGFATARYHPILHRYRPHVGIDLVAQYGTPVKAIADGRVISSDWAGELGKCVRVEHDHDMVSLYGHLSRISPDAKPGAYVRMGQVIGWVGTTGLSTGPHLHFAILREGRYVNPLSQKLGANHEVSPRLRAVFDQIKQRYQALLARLPDLGSHRVLAEQRKPAISPLGDLYHVELKHPSPSRPRIWRSTRTVSIGGSANAGL
jgi:murein DD-endopeptidase MepM/ murein hydrolase activator NlpD